MEKQLKEALKKGSIISTNSAKGCFIEIEFRTLEEMQAAHRLLVYIRAGHPIPPE